MLGVTGGYIYDFVMDNLQKLSKLLSTATVFIHSQCDDSFTLMVVTGGQFCIRSLG